jgi:hypothetical protein
VQALRNSKFIASFVLAWFGLFLGSAVAAAVIKPGSVQIVCAASGGMKLVDLDGNGKGLKASANMDCPLCASMAVPLPPHTALFDKPSSLAHALHPLAAAHIAASTAPPLPSRGPPSSVL